MTETILERIREGRKSGAVLKTRLSAIRSRYPVTPVLIFEGIDDVGPYASWLTRINDQLRYEALPATGKDQVLDLRVRLKADKGGLSAGVYFFVDRDFNDLDGQEGGPDIFCTATYSIENELVSEQVLERILVDEFRCTGESEDRERVLELFRKVLRDYAGALSTPNRRIYTGKRLGIRGQGVCDAIGKYITISLDAVGPRFDEISLKALVPLDREPTDEESAAVESEFAKLDPLSRHRGKFLLAFFLGWLDILACDRKRKNSTVFASAVDLKFSVQRLSLSSLANRSSLPFGLRDFAEGIRPCG